MFDLLILIFILTDGRKVNKSKMRTDSETNYYETQRKGKHKRYSKDRRKMKRYYSSESGSSSDSDTASSESKVNKLFSLEQHLFKEEMFNKFTKLCFMGSVYKLNSDAKS